MIVCNRRGAHNSGMRPTAKKSRAKAPKKIKRRRGKPSHKTPGRGRTEPKLSTDRRLAALQLERETLKHGLTEAKTRIAELERQVDEDPLMPVANRRAFLRELTRLIGFAEPVSYTHLDVYKRQGDDQGTAGGQLPGAGRAHSGGSQNCRAAAA